MNCAHDKRCQTKEHISYSFTYVNLENANEPVVTNQIFAYLERGMRKGVINWYKETFGVIDIVLILIV